MKKIIALAIVLSMILPSGALFAQEWPGAQLVITKTDGTEIKGELIAVKQDSTLILESSSRIGASIDISNIRDIKIVKGPNTFAGAFFGVLAGGAVGAAIGATSDSSGFRGLSAAAGGILGGLVGGLIGGAIGSSINSDETILIEGKSQEQIKAVLEKLRTQARFPKYR
jgi:hypothetical protein